MGSHRHLLSLLRFTKDFPISALTDNQLFSCFFLFCGHWRRVDLEEVSFSAVMWSITFSQPKHFSGDTSLSPGWKKNTKAKNYTLKLKLFFFVFFFNKHFTRSQTLIACDRSSKVMFYILSLTIISVHSAKPHGFSFLISKLWFLNKYIYISKGQQYFWTMVSVQIAYTHTHTHSRK